MAKNNDVGIFRLNNGCWGYRVTYMLNGKRKDSTFHRDDNGNPFTKKSEAKEARAKKLIELRTPTIQTSYTDCKLSDMWDFYKDNVAPSKATATVRKYSSLWEQHVKDKFGDRTVNDITVSELEAFLSDLYFYKNYSWKYVESFLKLFYQLFGLAYKEEHINSERYTRMFIDKGTKLHMPQISQEDYQEYEDIKTFNSYEISKIDEIFKQGDCYTAFLFGYYCGLRIGETFALMWSDYNWQTHKLTVSKQMTYEDGFFVLKPVKTLKSVREIDVPDVLHKHLMEKIRQQKKHTTDAYKSRMVEIVLDKTSNRSVKQIQGGDFINRKSNGELLTVNSIKYYSKKIKAETNIDFKYHSLRKTHLSYLANMNVPAVEVMNRAGHKKFETTMRYYVSQSENSRKMLLTSIETITTEEKLVEVDDGFGGKMLVKESTAIIKSQIASSIPH